MIKLYIAIFIVSLLAGFGYSAKYYYDTTQNTIATLRENNVKLEAAIQTATDSLNAQIEERNKLDTLNSSLQKDLQKAEAYGDSLRNKLNKLNLVKDALTDAKKLEGKMNGATAKIWREITTDTGGDSRPIPGWLQQPNGTRSESSNEARENNSTSSNTTETSPAQ
jgi:hypothetical protein